MSDDKKDDSGSGSSAPPADAKQGTAGLGDPVRDGKFEFVVNNVECDVATVGEDPVSKTAQGQFCLVNLSVKNIGDEPQTMSDANQSAVGSNGAAYNADTEAGLLANDTNSQVWLTDINPGNQVTGMLVFDVPKDVDLTTLTLHDSAFSGGVEVNVK